MENKSLETEFDDIFKSLQLNKNIKETIKKIKIMDEKKRKKMFSHIIEKDPFSIKKIINEAIPMMLLEDDESVKNLSILLEKTSRDMAFAQILEPLEKYAEDHPNLALKVSEKMLKYEKMEGACSGFILSTLIGKKIIDDEIIQNIASDVEIKQNQAYVSLRYAVYQDKDEIIQDIIIKALEHALNIGVRNKDVLIGFIVAAYDFDENNAERVIMKEFGDINFVRKFIYNSQYNENISIEIFKQAVEILEREGQDQEIIDEALSRIYPKDPKYVIDRILKRINNGEVQLVCNGLSYIIHDTDINPIIEMFEKEIVNGNYRVEVFGVNYLSQFISKDSELMELCKKWKNDDIKRKIVIDIIGRILSRKMNYEYSEEREDAISILKELVEKEGLDYDKCWKGVNIGKDKNDVNEYMQKTLRALAVIKSITTDPPSIPNDENIIRRNLIRYKNIKKMFDEKWVLDSIKKGKTHPLINLLGHDISDDDFQNFTTNQRSCLDSSTINILQALEYIEGILKIIQEKRLIIPTRNIKKSDHFVSSLSEIEVIARLAKMFKVTIEPRFEKLGKKKLDLLIEDNGDKAIIEIATVGDPLQLTLSHNATIGVPGGKVKHVLLYKFNDQLKKGTVDLKIPIIILLNIDALLPLDDEVLNAIYGRFGITMSINIETHDLVEEGGTRENNSFFEEENSDLVNYIGSYRRVQDINLPLKGKLYRPPLGIKPRNHTSRKFIRKLREALFGITEDDYISLTRINGIDKKKARKMYNNGIEDPGILAFEDLSKYCVPGIPLSELKEFQQEARRIIEINRTGRVELLKSVNDEILKILKDDNIGLIRQILERKKPKSIKHSTWSEIQNEAKRYR